MGTASRVYWVDVAKGIAILLVALYHSAFLGMQVGLVPDFWAPINHGFATLRMPLFFLASGLFAGSLLTGSWSSLWNRRLALLVWTFVIWTVIRFCYFALVPMAARPEEASWINLLISPVVPRSGLWFLHALVVFFVVAKLMRGRVPVRVQLAVSGVTSAAFLSFASVGGISWTGMGRYFVFFLAGCYAKDWILARTSAPRVALTVVALAVFSGGTVLVLVLDRPEIPGPAFLLAVVAVTAGVLLARCVADTPLRTPLSYLGQNSLPIYVTHVIVVAITLTAVAALPVELPPWLSAVLPLLLCAFAVGVPLGLHRLVAGTPLRVLYSAPRFLDLPPSQLRSQSGVRRSWLPARASRAAGPADPRST